MGFCVISFIGMFTLVLGVSMMIVMPGSMGIMVTDLSPLPLVLMLVGLILSFVILGMVRMMGSTASYVDKKAVYYTVRGTMWLGFIASIATCIIQTYIRFKYNTASFLLFKNCDALSEVLRGNVLDITDGKAIFAILALCLFIGLPWFIISFFEGDFTEYVTVTMVDLGDGVSFESKRSESYLPVGQFVLMGALLTIPVLFLANTPIAYLFPAPFGMFFYGIGSKKNLIRSGAIFGGIGAILALVSILCNLA